MIHATSELLLTRLSTASRTLQPYQETSIMAMRSPISQVNDYLPVRVKIHRILDLW